MGDMLIVGGHVGGHGDTYVTNGTRERGRENYVVTGYIVTMQDSQYIHASTHSKH